MVGNVTGHDRDAAAVMGQVRNMLRALAHTLSDPPALVMSAADRAMRDLQVGTLATAVLATVEQNAEQREAGVRALRWTSAGHLPPVLVEPGGSSRLLTTDPDLLLGLEPATARADHLVELQPGSTLVLYTDGLVERRGVSIDDGLAWLLTATQCRQELTPDQLCDLLLEAVVDTAEDDIALLVMRVHPEDRGRSRTPLSPGRAASAV